MRALQEAREKIKDWKHRHFRRRKRLTLPKESAKEECVDLRPGYFTCEKRSKGKTPAHQGLRPEEVEEIG